MWKTSQKVTTKKREKSFEKVLTKREEYDILFELSSREGKRLDLEN